MSFLKRFTRDAVDLPDTGDLDEVVEAWPEEALEDIDDEEFERAISEGRRGDDDLFDAA